MKEYGGYIELEKFYGTEFHQNAIALNSGRHCLEYIIKAKKIVKLFLPYFLCDSVQNICQKMNIETERYHIDASLDPIFDGVLHEGEYLYLVNYYGQLSNNKISLWADRYQHIIVDNVQAFFQMPVSKVDTLYSCRKFFGVADGAYLYTNSVLEEPLNTDFSYDRMHFLLGRYEKEASLFYDEYANNNDSFDQMPMRSMSKLTHNLLRGIDYKYVEKQRTQNFKYLHERFKSNNKLELTVSDGGFMYPLYLAEGEDMRKRLQKRKIYIPTLWPDVFDVCSTSDLEYDMAKNILPLPIDQRYSIEDMAYIADQVEMLKRK